jgi:SAM-dependent methyltransferase
MTDQYQAAMTAKITGCEVCGATELRNVLDLGLHPLCDDLVALADERECVEYPIVIAYCPNCRTAHQTYQVPKRTLFSESYHYRARHTADVLKGMAQLVDSCEMRLGSIARLTVLDIGCNDGSLLSICAQRGAKTYGIEPTGAAADAVAAGHTIYQDYFSPELAAEFVRDHGQPDVVVFTNVFAHIEDLGSVLRAVGTLMSERTLLVIENHYLGAVLARNQFDTFYHEHPRTYSLTSFQHIAKTLGARIVLAEFPARYGGNIRVMMQRDPSAAEADLSLHLAHEQDFESGLVEMARRVPLWRDRKRAELDALVAEYGPIRAKAFPGRAAILVKLLGIDEGSILAVHEKPGSMKVGHYVPGTRIPIQSDDDVDLASEQRPLLNLAWHISAEIHGYLRNRGFTAQIVDLLAQEEFDGLSDLAEPPRP